MCNYSISRHNEPKEPPAHLNSVQEAELGRVAKDDDHPVLDDSGRMAGAVDLPAEIAVTAASVHRLHLPGQAVQVEGPKLLKRTSIDITRI